MAKCTSCGGDLRYDIASASLQCKSCGTGFDPYEIDRVSEAETQTDSMGVTVFTCPQCAGEMVGMDHELNGKCSFCGSEVVFSSRMGETKKPKYIIPFQKTKEECKQIYLKAVNDYRFTPKELKDPKHIDEFRGIYVPYWLYEVSQEGDFSFSGTTTKSSGNYEIIDYYTLTGHNSSRYNQIPHDASSVLYDDISERVEPFEFKFMKKDSVGLKPFTPSFFSGFYAETPDVEAETYHEYARNVADDMTKHYIDHGSPTAKYTISLPNNIQSVLNSEVEGHELAAVPIWFLSYRKKDRVAYAAINGQTGRFVSDIPIDFGKMFRFILIFAAVFFAALSFMTILPITVTLISVICSSLITKFAYDDVRAVAERTENTETKKKRGKGSSSTMVIVEFVILLICLVGFQIFAAFDDDVASMATGFMWGVIAFVSLIIHMVRAIKVTGLQARLKRGVYSKVPYQWINVFVAAIGTFSLFAEFVQDVYYYGVATFVIAIEVITLSAIIKNYNKVATKPLPQFSVHKGGDDRA